MDPIIMKLTLLAVTGLGLLASTSLMAGSYRGYYKRMKDRHPEEWARLMNKDRVVADFGAWTRWPIGSSYFMLSIMQRHHSYGDDEISALKQRFRSALVGFAISFFAFLLLVALMPYVK